MSMGNRSGECKPLECKGGRVKQAFRDVCDINKIVARARKSGSFDFVSSKAPVFADVSELGDFRSLVVRVRAAQEAFEGLPAAIRSRFHNDAAELVEFMSNAENKAEAVKLGLIVPVPAAPVPAAPVPAVPPAVVPPAP